LRISCPWNGWGSYLPAAHYQGFMSVQDSPCWNLLYILETGLIHFRELLPSTVSFNAPYSHFIHLPTLYYFRNWRHHYIKNTNF
jgi:hypothetical protein